MRNPKTSRLQAEIQIEVIRDDFPEGSAIGITTLRHYYTIYNLETNEVGFVP